MSPHDEAAAALVDLLNERYRLTAAMAADGVHVTSAHVEEVLAAGRRLDEAAEAFRRRFYPRRDHVIVAGGRVLVCSPTRRNVTCVYPGRRGLSTGTV